MEMVELPDPAYQQNIRLSWCSAHACVSVYAAVRMLSGVDVLV